MVASRNSLFNVVNRFLSATFILFFAVRFGSNLSRGLRLCVRLVANVFLLALAIAGTSQQCRGGSLFRARHSGFSTTPPNGRHLLLAARERDRECDRRRQIK